MVVANKLGFEIVSFNSVPIEYSMKYLLSKINSFFFTGNKNIEKYWSFYLEDETQLIKMYYFPMIVHYSVEKLYDIFFFRNSCVSFLSRLFTVLRRISVNYTAAVLCKLIINLAYCMYMCVSERVIC